MEDLKQDLALLFELQNYDIKISDVNKQISLVPSLIEQKNIILNHKKAELNEKKKKYIDLVLLKKEKEYLLADKEKAIEKYFIELNAVKSNNTYKALLLKIEKVKTSKSILEDDILMFMEKVDEESVRVKAAENEFQEFEENIKKEITDIKNNVDKLKEEAIALENKREDRKLKVSKFALSHYERLKEGRNGCGVAMAVIVSGESCGYCGMVLRTQLINQVLKGQEFVFCDNCSRILFKNNAL
jgi:predicted  nucleic acid-binding Zn-ribbon protein